MVATLEKQPTFRIIPSRFPPVGFFDTVARPEDLEVVLLLEAATNPRLAEEAGDLTLVRNEERVCGPGSTPVMRAFTQTGRNSRFSDGTYGVWYAGFDQTTAIADTAYHRERFLQANSAPIGDERIDMRLFRGNACGRYDDVRTRAADDAIYDPQAYAAGQAYARKIYACDELDGIVYCSVRRKTGVCIAVFRPPRVSNCPIAGHFEYRFHKGRLAAVIPLGDPTT